MTGIYAENSEGIFKKSVLEAASYAYTVAGGPVTAVCVGNPQAGEAEKLAAHGVHKLIIINGLEAFDAQQYTDALASAFSSAGVQTIVAANTYEAKSLAPRLAVKLSASLVTNVVDYPDTGSGFKVKRGVFSGKGFAWVSMDKAVKIIAITPNSTELKSNPQNIAVETISVSATAANTKITAVSKTAGKIPLTEAEYVVSAGRGMKGPEHWGMVEELAELLGAATACSKPVSDMGWRPHSEHVGQTGITIKPNLYIAIGISGAIQHLAGVSSSKVIVAINKDPEAPFFKAADYGIVGDAFEVLPQLIQAAKAAKN